MNANWIGGEIEKSDTDAQRRWMEETTEAESVVRMQ